MDVNIVELQKDLDELDKLLEITTRLNIKRNLENHKKTIAGLIESEKKALEKAKEKEKAKVDDTNITNTIKATVEDKYQYTTITGYGFESTDKFAK